MQCFMLHSYWLVAQNLANWAPNNVIAFTLLSFFCNISPYCLSPVFKPASSWCNFSHSHYSIYSCTSIPAPLYYYHYYNNMHFSDLFIVNLNIEHNGFSNWSSFSWSVNIILLNGNNYIFHNLLISKMLSSLFFQTCYSTVS